MGSLVAGKKVGARKKVHRRTCGILCLLLLFVQSQHNYLSNIDRESVKLNDYIVDGRPANYWKNKDAMVDAVKHMNRLDRSMHYSELPVGAVKSVVGRFHPVHRLNVDILKKVIRSGSLESRHFRERIDESALEVLEEQLCSDLRIRALMLRFLKDSDSKPIMQRWLVAVARLRLLKRQMCTSSVLKSAQKEVDLRELEMRAHHHWQGLTFELRENQGVVVTVAAATATFFSLGAVGGVVRGVLAGGSAGESVLMFSAAAAMFALGGQLLGPFLSSMQTRAGGGALALSQLQWDDQQDMKVFAEELRQIKAVVLRPRDEGYNEVQSLVGLDKQLQADVKRAKTVKELLDALIERAEQHVDDVHYNSATGVGYNKDMEIGTNKRVFAILGPHTGTEYGSICIVLKQSIMYHPWFDVTPCAGTSFLSERALMSHPWLKAKKYGCVSNRDRFHMARLNAGTMGWKSAISAALAHAIGMYQGRAWRTWLGEGVGLHDMKEEDVLQYYGKQNSHAVIEAHMPEIVPLPRYAHMVIIPQKDWDKLKDDDKEQLKELVGDDRVKVVDDTKSPDAIIGNCFSNLNESIFYGFAFTMDHWQVDTARRLPGVQPQYADAARVTLDARGPCQVLLGPAQGKGHGIAIALYSPSDEGKLAEDGFVTNVGRMKEANDPTAANDPAEGHRVCFAASEMFEDGIVSFVLARDDEGVVKPQINICAKRFTVVDRVKGGTTVCDTGMLGDLTMSSVAAKRGPVVADTEIEIRNLQLK